MFEGILNVLHNTATIKSCASQMDIAVLKIPKIDIWFEQIQALSKNDFFLFFIFLIKTRFYVFFCEKHRHDINLEACHKRFRLNGEK